MAELRNPRARQRDHAHRLLRTLEARVLPVVQEALDHVAEEFARRALHQRRALVAQGEPVDPLDLTLLATMWGVEVPAVLAALRAVYEASELETVRRFGGDALANAVTSDPAHPLARTLAERVEDHLATAGTRITNVGDTLVEAAQSVLLDGNVAGEGVDEIAQRLQEAFARHGEQLGDTRAERIVRTEVQSAWENASRDTARSLPEDIRPQYKTWLASLDFRTRLSHFQVDGVAIPLNELFDVGGVLMDGPHDPAAPPEEAINCRCDLAFGDDPENLPALGIDRQYKDDESIQRVLDFFDAQGVTRNADQTASAFTLRDSVAAGIWPGPAQGAHQMPNPLPPPPEVVAAAHAHDGAMIALVPTEQDAARLALDDSEPADELHVTLAYLGPAGDWTAEQRQAVVGLLQQPVAGIPDQAIAGRAFGAAHWNPDSDNPAWVLNVGGDDLDGIHGAVWEALLNGDAPWPIPEQYTPWAAHMCLAYSPDRDLLPAMEQRLGDITFDRIRIAFAGEHTDIPLTGARDATAAADDQGRPVRRWSTPPPTALAFEDQQTGDGRIFTAGALYWDGPGPWPLQYADEMLSGHAGAELAGAIETVFRDGQRITGIGILHSDTEAGDRSIGLLEQDAPLGVSVDLDDVDLEVVDARPEAERQAEPIASFTGRAMSVLALPDGRWRIRSTALLQDVTAAAAAAGISLTAAAGITAAAGDHDEPDGEVLFVERAGDLLLRITRGRLRGATLVSMPAFADARIVLDPADTGGLDPITTPGEAQAQVGELMMEVLDYVASAGRPVRPGEVADALGIGGSLARTYLSRAVASARLARPARGLYTTVATASASADGTHVTAAAVGNLDLPIQDDRDHDWDGGAAASRVLEWANGQAEGTDDPPSRWIAQAFLHYADGQNPNAVGSYALGFADVVDDELRIVARGVFATAGGRGVDAADIPDEEKEQIRARICRLYSRLAEHFDDEDLVCPWERDDEEASAYPMVASAWSEFQALPPLPAAWFAEPTQQELPPDSGGVHVTDDGRVYGWVAQRGVPHDAFPGRNLTLDDLDPIDLSHFLRARFRLDNGQSVRAGAFTMNTGHHRDGAECETSACQFDDTRTVAGVVTVGLNDRGMWFSGAAAPWLSPWDLAVFAACQPSYHMTANPDGRGYSLRAVLSVPRPGHPSRLAAAAMVDRSNLALTPAAVRPATHRVTAAAAPPLDYTQLAVAVVDEQERRVQARAEAAALRAEMDQVRAEVAHTEVAALKAEIEGER